MAAGLLPAGCADEPGQNCVARLAALNRSGAAWDAWLLTDSVVCSRRPDPVGVQEALRRIDAVHAAPGGRLVDAVALLVGAAAAAWWRTTGGLW